MTDPAPHEDVHEVACPHCGDGVAVALTDCGEARACPHCAMPFEVPLPPRAVPARRGRLLRFRCLRCSSMLEAPADRSGQQARCPTCNGVFTVPEVDPATGLACGNADPGPDGQFPTPMHAYGAAGERAPKLVRRDDDVLEIECPRCSRTSGVASDVCPQCGLPFTLEGQRSVLLIAEDDSGSTNALVFGIGSVLTSLCPFAGVPFGVVAIILGIRALRRSAPHPARARVAIVLGGLACILPFAIVLWPF